MRAAFLVAGLVAVAGAQDINRTCVNDADTRRINSGFNPCTHSEVADGNKMIPGTKSGPPVVLVHGMFHGAWYWKGMQEQLASNGHEAHAFTFQATSKTTTLQEMSAALYAFILAGSGDGGGLSEPSVIVGHSTGGHIVQHFMLTHALLLPEEIRPKWMVLMGSGCNEQPCDTESDAAVQKWLEEKVAEGAFNVKTANCNTAMSSALFFQNGTNATDVTGEELDMAEYACKLRNEQGGTYCTYCVTPEGWEYTITPLQRMQGRLGLPPMLAMIQQSEFDVFNNAINSSFMIDHLLGTWVGATPLRSPNQAHAVGDPGWELSVAEPIVAWITKEANPSTGKLSKGTLVAVGIGAVVLIILIVIVMMYVARRRTRSKYESMPDSYSSK